jgi:hypothetical protein
LQGEMQHPALMDLLDDYFILRMRNFN